ncbi:hypothetical protein ABIC63_000547 [Pseudacidovorax sp. 1753]|uniref:hypothetical protein n=1 Tax=Pseudacidovorax sp. 1753 TaxID=3156419 RepID=UPI00339695A9
MSNRAKANPLLLRRVLEELPRFAYRFADEVELHEGMAQVLTGAGVPFVREHIAGPQDRFDFLIDSGIVIEAKVKGSLPPALQQCARYLDRDDVSVVILAVTRYWGKAQPEYRSKRTGKSIHTVHLRGASF